MVRVRGLRGYSVLFSSGLKPEPEPDSALRATRPPREAQTGAGRAASCRCGWSSPIPGAAAQRSASLTHQHPLAPNVYTLPQSPQPILKWWLQGVRAAFTCSFYLSPHLGAQLVRHAHADFENRRCAGNK
ncbi:unnamed protein product [Rangifer tarandus platyrhynchus]|uniref:Uncharacterized protein n=1 Tax=Rangifer tarandus platyrhynchus TaxID=3082113 RepID=A0AC59YDL4_RANTA